MSEDMGFIISNEEELLKQVYGMEEGCFLYLRDNHNSPRSCFYNFIKNVIHDRLLKNEENKLWLIENQALDEDDNFKLNITFKELSKDHLLDEIDTEDFGCGYVVLMLSSFMNMEVASKNWLKMIHYKVNNISPSAETFGSEEIFSITGDSNILIWTNSSSSKDDLKKLALDSDYQYFDENITVQVYK